MEVFTDWDAFGDKVREGLAQVWGFEVVSTGGVGSSFKCKSVKGCSFYVKATRPKQGIDEIEIDYSKSIFKHTHVLTKGGKVGLHFSTFDLYVPLISPPRCIEE